MFSHNLGQHRSLTLPFEPFRFWLRIRGDIHNQNWLPDSASQGIAGSPYWWVGESPTPHIGESPTPCISESGSHRLPALVSWGVANSPYWWVGESAIKLLKENSPYGWIGESATPRLSDSGSCCLNTFLKTLWLKKSGSCRLYMSVSRRVGDFELATPQIVQSQSGFSILKISTNLKQKSEWLER